MQQGSTSNLLRYLLAVLIAPVMSACLADTASDCSLRMPLSKIIPELSRGCPDEKKMERKPGECIPLDSPMQSNSQSKFDIDLPGHYCLTRDLHARIEFADHPAEGAMIIIWSSDVILDLQGHTLGRGRLFKNPGGHGIEIADDKYTNIRIKNGILQDFDIGVDRYDFPTSDEMPNYDAQTNTYRFPISNIFLENITFKNNKKNFQIRIPRKTKLQPKLDEQGLR